MNARVRQFLEHQPAPVLAWMIDHGWVHEYPGFFTTYAGNIGVAVAMARKAVTPEIEQAREKRVKIARLRERL